MIWINDLALLQARPVDVDELIARATAWGVRVPLSLSLIQIERTFPGLVGPRLASWARGFKRARWLIARFGRPDGALLFDRWWLRRRQLLLGLAMLDGPVQAIRALAGWAARARRHGDAAGLRRPAPHAGTGSERL
ncbi:MAG: hypothetical protein JSV80_11030 [Acidobacteriota bacterium]|nr:MAG: hypothetical protein JSV80_11030 [Acidobacteriota bacterium]